MRSVNRVGKSMQDLRLVGVHDDGEHLLLSGAGGEIYRLRIDEALRVASSRTPPRPAAPMSQDSAPGRLSPKDIQQRIRGGASAEDVAEAAKTVSDLMGNLVEPRKEFIQKYAKEVKNLDI